MVRNCGCDADTITATISSAGTVSNFAVVVERL
jgi:hypothetical protein